MHRSTRRRSFVALLVTMALSALSLVSIPVLGATAAHADSAPQLSIDDITQVEGNSGTVSYVFTVRLGVKSNLEVDVNYASADNTAIAPADYTPVHGTLVFSPGTTSKTITVLANGNLVHDANRSFSVNLLNPVNATITDSLGYGTIVDNDPLPYVNTGNAVVTKPSSGSANLAIPLTLSNASSQTVSVHYATVNGSALAGTDYTYAQGWATFAPGTTSQTVNVAVLGNGRNDGNKYLYLNTGSPVNAGIETNQGVGYITNPNPVPTITINNVQQAEGNAGTTNAVFTVSLQPASSAKVTLTYTTADGSATLANNDYQYAQGTLTFNPGETTKTISVPVVGDTTAEGNEYFYVNLANVVNASAQSTSGVAYVVNDDPSATALPGVQVGDQTVIEGDSGTSSIVLPVTLSAASASTVTVAYATSDGSATAPGDYTASTGTVTFTAGETAKTITVPVVGDTLAESDEYLYVTLSSPTNATIIDNQAVARIINNDVNPVVSATSNAIAEGASGTTVLPITVSLSAASANTVTVSYATSDGTAVAGSDYVATNGPLTFAPGETSKVVNVTVNGDTIREADEYFTFGLSAAVNASVGAGTWYGEIVNDDYNPGITVNDATVYEGQSGTTSATFTVRLSPASANTVTVNYATSDGSGIAGTDYTAKSGTVTFLPGQTSQNVAVSVNGNTKVQPNRYFNFNLGSPVNADLIDNLGYGTIVDDDVNPVMNVGDVTLAEGTSGTTSFVFPVTLTSASANTVTVNYATSDGSATVAGGDYASTTGALTFTPGQTSKTVTVPVTGDTTIEGDEYFSLSLSGVTNAVLSDGTAYGVILNDDATPKLSITSHAIVEGSSGSAFNSLTVVLQPASPNTVTVNYATSDGSATLAGGDYQSTTGTLTFTPGQTTKTVDVPVLGDTTPESNEYFNVNLSGASGAAITTASGYGIIVNDDATGQAPASYLSVNDAAVTEGNTGTVNESFTINLSPASATAVSVNYSTADSSATANGGDYTSTVGTVTFAPGETSKVVPVSVNGNTVATGDRTFAFNLSGAVGATIENNATGYIVDDDRPVRATINDAAVVEPDTGTTNAVFTVSLSAAYSQPVFIDYATANDSAVAPSDYTPTFGTLTFAPGQTTKTVSVPVNGDNAIEGTEDFTLGLSSAVNTVLNDTTGQANIFDTDVFTDSGNVKSGNGSNLAGVTMTVTGNNRPSQTTLTDASGNFTLPYLPDGSYTITPTRSGYKFFPTSTSITVRGAAVTGTNFLGETGAYIEGIATTAGGSALSGVTITRSGNAQPDVVVTTNAAGYYAIPASPAGTYTITPTKATYTFNPPSYSVTLGATAVTARDLIGVTAAYVVGRVATAGGVGVAGVTMTRTGNAQPTVTVKTNSQGYYGFAAQPVTAGGVTYTITPTLTGKTFTPTSANVNLSTTLNATQDFVSS